MQCSAERGNAATLDIAEVVGHQSPLICNQ